MDIKNPPLLRRICGGPYWTRTNDPRDVNTVLYQLSQRTSSLQVFPADLTILQHLVPFVKPFFAFRGRFHFYTKMRGALTLLDLAATIMSMSKSKKKKSWVRVLVLLVCIPVFCVSAYMVFSQLYVDYRQSQTFGSLQDQVNQARAGAGNVSAADVESDGETAIDPDTSMLSYYLPLHAMNPDFFGWIEIEDTEINYPVMHTPEDPEFYLHRAFDGSEAYSGVPFLDANCFLDCGNYIVYGHNMKNGTMFKTITYYEDKAFWEEHPTVRFDTLYDTGTYDIIAAFYSQAYPADAVGVFRYYQYTDLHSEDLFNEYMEQVKIASLYDTGIEAEFGDQLLTLSTCEYHRTDGRFVVVAKKRGA